MLSRRGGSAAGLAGARLASGGRARRHGEARARRRGLRAEAERGGAARRGHDGAARQWRLLGLGHGGAGARLGARRWRR